MITIDENSNIPLLGLDFIGILDRGTNLIEIKPITTCNLHCKYCFVNAGEYHQNFMIEKEYIIKWTKLVIDHKQCSDIEVHIAPYGEFFLYDDYFWLLKHLKKIPEIKTISIQTNGTLLDESIIGKLEEVGLDRLNISFNSFNPELARHLSGNDSYSVERMLNLFKLVLDSSINLLIAPIWFFGVNDEDIEKIIKYSQNLHENGIRIPKFRLGIQNYLRYKTGRKLNKVTERDFSYFYSRLSALEKKYKIKLKLGPRDFNIHKVKPIVPPVEIGQSIKVQIISKGRTNNEYIGIINSDWAVKVLCKIDIPLNSVIKPSVIKKKKRENLITAVL